jgi:hypothetical protein
MMKAVHTLLLLLLFCSFLEKPSPAASPARLTLSLLRNDEKMEDHEFIPWTHNRILTWDDFQSAPNRGSDAVASTSTSLGLAYQVKDRALTFEITCKFSKTKSWGSLKTDYILAHEQGHFNITEIYARKLYQELSLYKLNPRTYQQDLNRIYQKIVKEKENMQNLYDGQSDHSRNKKVQANWAEIINTLLEETQVYSSYP